MSSRLLDGATVTWTAVAPIPSPITSPLSPVAVAPPRAREPTDSQTQHNGAHRGNANSGGPCGSQHFGKLETKQKA